MEITWITDLLTKIRVQISNRISFYLHEEDHQRDIAEQEIYGISSGCGHGRNEKKNIAMRFGSLIAEDTLFFMIEGKFLVHY